MPERDDAVTETSSHIEATSAAHSVTWRDIVALALPALGVLAAPPLYLLLDTAVVGRLGALELAALAAGSTIFAMVTTQLTFLAYGTTARASRAFGGGNRAAAVREGIQATWVAIGVGAVLLALVAACASVFSAWLAPDPAIAGEAAKWLAVACIGIPLTLITQAGNGWLRGVQNTRRPLVFVIAGLAPASAVIVPLVNTLGLVGSAVAVVIGETITAILFLRELAVNARDVRVSLKPDSAIIRSQLVLGRDLIARSLAFQVAFLSAAAVAARIGAQALGGHQIMLQLWSFLTMLLDSLAIAAQSLVGAALGFGSVAIARWTSRRVVAWSGIFAGIFAVVFAAGFRFIPAIFSSDDGVISTIIAGPWWLLIAMIPVGGVVFALDGVLLGAGDAAFLRNATITAVVFGFIPPVWLTYFLGWGLTGIWSGLLLFLVIRLVFVVTRYKGSKWHATISSGSL